MWFQDEARVRQQGTLTRVWARRGTRPRAVRDTRYQWAYIFGAVCPGRTATAALVLPYADTEAMNLHLTEIARAVAPGAHAVLVLEHDRLGDHRPEPRHPVPEPSRHPPAMQRQVGRAGPPRHAGTVNGG
ncbi:MAG: transposase [Amaricoccus sp.]